MSRTPRNKPLAQWHRRTDSFCTSTPVDRHKGDEYLPVGPLTPGISRLLDDDGQPYEIDTYIDYFFVYHGRKIRRVWMAEDELYMEEYGVHNILADEKQPNALPLAAFIWQVYHACARPPWITGFAYLDNDPRNCTWDNLVEVIDHERKAQKQQQEVRKSQRQQAKRKEKVA